MNHIFPILFSYPLAHIYKQICSPNSVVIQVHGLNHLVASWCAPVAGWSGQRKISFVMKNMLLRLCSGPNAASCFFFLADSQRNTSRLVVFHLVLKRTGGINWPYAIIYGELAWTVSKKWSWHAHHRIFFAFLFWIFQRFLKKLSILGSKEGAMSGTHKRQLHVEFTPFLSSSETTLLCKFWARTGLDFVYAQGVGDYYRCHSSLSLSVYLSTGLSLYLSMYWYINNLQSLCLALCIRVSYCIYCISLSILFIYHDAPISLIRLSIFSSPYMYRMPIVSVPCCLFC